MKMTHSWVRGDEREDCCFNLFCRLLVCTFVIVARVGLIERSSLGSCGCGYDSNVTRPKSGERFVCPSRWPWRLRDWQPVAVVLQALGRTGTLHPQSQARDRWASG